MTFAELFATVLIALGLVALSAYIVSVYTEMVRLFGHISRSLARIDVLRCRLVDEVPKLIKICEGDETGVEHLDRLRMARRHFEDAADAHGRDDAARRLDEALRTLFEIVEVHPDVHVQPSFERLYHRVTDLQSQIDESCAVHDETAVVFNCRLEGWVERRVAGWLSLGPITPFATRGETRLDEAVDLAVPA